MPAHVLPKALYTARLVRALDALAIERQGIAGYELMCRAGAAALAALRRRHPQARRLRVWCGAGNNGGDGYVLARLARAEGLDAVVVAVADPAALRGDARSAYEDFTRHGGRIVVADAAAPQVEIDALLGTGLTRPVAGKLAAAVQAVNASPAPVVAIDIPSGIDADSGAVTGAAVRADLTVTFIGLKQGLFTGAAVDHVGELVYESLGCDSQCSEGGIAPAAWRLERRDLRGWLPARPRSAHKGSHGTVLVAGGGIGMPGAVRLAAESALRAGAGLVRAATLPEHLNAIVAGCPEIICHGVDDGPRGLDRLRGLAGDADVIALGPGLGQSDWSRRAWSAALDSGRPVVLDADGLNLLAQAPRRRGDWVLTPHPGEAARLLGGTVPEVQRDRFAAAAELVRRYGGCVVLKGAGTLVMRDGCPPWLCDRGNPGMATAGMGDVLTGVIAGLLAQLGDAWTAARAGTLIHALAGDAAAAAGQRGLLASDLLPHVRDAANP